MIGGGGIDEALDHDLIPFPIAIAMGRSLSCSRPRVYSDVVVIASGFQMRRIPEFRRSVAVSQRCETRGAFDRDKEKLKKKVKSFRSAFILEKFKNWARLLLPGDSAGGFSGSGLPDFLTLRMRLDLRAPR
jgi:hypothetical protein